ncbi:MAG: hypothetical protein MI794_08720 [Pseudomonadales bacterium]|nr:hypothetical protein [Pseudomonadales bacterium]
MQVIGGHFGADGKAGISGTTLVINGQDVTRPQINSMSVQQSSKRELSITSLLAGMIVLVPLAWIFFSFFGGLVMLLLTIAGSFPKRDSRIVNVEVEGGKTASIQCNKKEAELLMRFAP